jgi:hypothetical protein
MDRKEGFKQIAEKSPGTYIVGLDAFRYYDKRNGKEKFLCSDLQTIKILKPFDASWKAAKKQVK